MTPSDADADSFVVLAWNPWTGAKADHVLDVLDRQIANGRPTVIVLNEVRRHWHELARWAKRNGYDVFQEKPTRGPGIPEQGSTALLVSRRAVDQVEVLSDRVVPMLARWTVFSHNTRRNPRRYLVVRLNIDGWRIKVRASHWPTNGFTGGNRVAFAESAARAAGWLRSTRPGRTALDIGDHNESVLRLIPWAKGIGATVDGFGPDSCIAVGADVDARKVAKFGSDHYLMRYRVSRRRANRKGNR